MSRAASATVLKISQFDWAAHCCNSIHKQVNIKQVWHILRAYLHEVVAELSCDMTWHVALLFTFTPSGAVFGFSIVLYAVT